MWKDSIRNIVVIFQLNILRIVGFYVRHSAKVWAHFYSNKNKIKRYKRSMYDKLSCWIGDLLVFV